MAKIKVSADTVLSILQGIMNSEEINYEITDKSAPVEWQGKKMQDVLNVEYYTFRHRPMDTEIIIRDLMNQGLETDSLYSLTRSFCILSLDSVERVYSKDNDIVTISANLEYWLQADKAKLLEDLVEDMTIETNGIRIPVQIGKEERQALIVLGKLDVSEIQDETEFGEMAICDLQVDIVLYPNVVSKSDYNAEFLINDGQKNKWVKLPFSSLSFSFNMNQKAIPYSHNVRNVGNANLSRVKSFVFTFDGFENEFIDDVANTSLASDYGDNIEYFDNNKQIILRITRKDKSYLYNCIIKDHTITIQEDTGNEVHGLTLTTRRN
ncbi:MAG: hypothetical protein IJX25_00290 [Clostridia bacterium]|nr:hypothetical protein [Clostridia bacterium]